jgi:hypothetical protein
MPVEACLRKHFACGALVPEKYGRRRLTDRVMKEPMKTRMNRECSAWTQPNLNEWIQRTSLKTPAWGKGHAHKVQTR